VASLSKNEKFSYDASGLASALQKSNLLNLNDQQKSVSAKAGNFIATAATTYYRKKKLKQYLGQADSSFQNLTETFLYLIDNRLRAQLKFEHDASLANLKQMLDNTNDRAVKQMVIRLYLDEQDYFNKHNKLIDTYAALLKSVQKGYHELNSHRDKLNAAGTKDLINRYSQELQYLAASVK
jgi:hypothetical protein